MSKKQITGKGRIEIKLKPLGVHIDLEGFKTKPIFRYGNELKIGYISDVRVVGKYIEFTYHVTSESPAVREMFHFTEYDITPEFQARFLRYTGGYRLIEISYVGFYKVGHPVRR